MTVSPGLVYGTSYLLGSIPTGLWLGKAWKGIDVRQQGSGNLGATNVFRVLGAGPGALTLALDILKGFAAVALAKCCYPGILQTSVIAGICAILGHTMSIFVRFRGGKGVATSGGVFLGLLPIPTLAALLTFAIVFGVSRYVSVGSLSAAAVLVGASFAQGAPAMLSWMAVAVALLVTWTHRGNIQRLMNGTENRIEFKKKAT